MLSRCHEFVWSGLGRGIHDADAGSSRGVMHARSLSPSSVLATEESDVDFLVDVEDYNELIKLVETKSVRSEHRRVKVLRHHEAHLEAFDGDFLERVLR